MLFRGPSSGRARGICRERASASRRPPLSVLSAVVTSVLSSVLRLPSRPPLRLLPLRPASLARRRRPPRHLPNRAGAPRRGAAARGAGRVAARRGGTLPPGRARGRGEARPDDPPRHPLRDRRQLPEHPGLRPRRAPFSSGPRPRRSSGRTALSRAKGYGLLVHDAYRPWWVTWVFWEATPVDKREFVADPAKGSRHNRGCAVDLTLYTPRRRPRRRDAEPLRRDVRARVPGLPRAARRRARRRDLLRARDGARRASRSSSRSGGTSTTRTGSKYPILNVPFERDRPLVSCLLK